MMEKHFYLRKKLIKLFRVPVALLLVLILLSGQAKGSVAKAGDITTIDATTFRGNWNIDTIHIGSSVSEITSNAFTGLMRLRSITVSSDNPFYSSYSNCLYNKEQTELLCFPPALSGAYIPGSVISIRENALDGVPDAIRAQVRSLVDGQAAEGFTEDEISGPHFIHTENGVRWKSEDGSIQSPSNELMLLSAQVISSCTTGAMTQSEQLKACYDYLVNTNVYEKKLDVPIGYWTATYAKELLATGKGDCYHFASAFAYIARGLGYNSRICTGTIDSGLGSKTPHAWTEVQIGGTWYIFDTAMQAVKGGDYYKQSYNSYPSAPIVKEAGYTVYY